MGTILVTPSGESVWANRKRRTLWLPPTDRWEEVDESVARAKGEMRIAPKDFETRLARLEIEDADEMVDLAGDGQIRIGASLGLTNNGKPVLGSFSETHPTRPGELTPVAGIYQWGNPVTTAKEELCQEFILVNRERGVVGVWSFGGQPILWERAVEYALEHRLRFDPSQSFDIRWTTSDRHWTIIMGELVFKALLQNEADTSSLEVQVTAETSLPAGWEIVDGERLDKEPGRPWRNSRVVTSDYASHRQTTKAQEFLRAYEAGLRLAP